MTLLTVVQDALNELGEYEIPAAIVGSSNPTAKQALALANRELRLLAGRVAWSPLSKEYTFNTVASTAQYALPSDYRSILTCTWWDGTDKWPLVGPASAAEWQTLKNGIYQPVTRFWFRITPSSGIDKFELYPVPDAVYAIHYTYASTDLVRNAAGNTFYSAYGTTDTDVALIDEDLITMGLKWRFLRQKGLPYSEEFGDYERAAQRAMARDGGSRPVYLDGPRLVRYPGVPETGFGQ